MKSLMIKLHRFYHLHLVVLIKQKYHPRENYSTSVPERIKREVGEYALIHGIKSALEKFGKKYPKYTFIRTSVNGLKKKIDKEKK